jgi:general stress protein 26
MREGVGNDHRQETIMQTRTDQEAHDKVFDLIKNIRVAQLVTTDTTGKLHARPMVAQQERFDGVLWFFTSAGSGKIDQIEHNPDVLLGYSDPSGQNYVSVVGTAEIVRDRAKVRELWSEPVRVWFPKGADDPDIALVRDQVREAEYWDAPSSTFLHAYGYVKALATGKRPDPGDTAHVDFDHAGGRHDEGRH